MTVGELNRLFFRYLNGRANENETHAIDEWYKQLHIEHPPVSDSEKQEIATRIRQKLRILTANKQRTSRLFIIRVAAILLTAITITLYLYQQQAAKPELNQLIVISNTTLKDSLVKLPDASTVLLERGAVLEYPRQFSSAKRTVRLLKGEGFFAIAHKENHPFSVDCLSGLHVVVLGTSFSIKHEARSKQVFVKVETGRVALKKGKYILATLHRGQSVQYDILQQKALMMKTECKRNVPIVFRESSLAAAAKELSYLYHINIKLSRNVDPALRSTASFSSHQEASEILSLLCKLHGLQLHISKDKSTYIINNQSVSTKNMN